VLVPALVLLACGPGVKDRSSSEGAEAAANLVAIAVSLPPLAWLAEAVGGERVAVMVLLLPGSTPETFEPTPRQMLELSQARVVLVVGHPAFPFEERLLHSLLERDGETGGAQVVRMVGASRDAAPEVQSLAARDPHVWLSPTAVASAARDLAAALERVDPDSAPGYAQRLAATLAEIERIEGEVEQILAGRQDRRFLVVHPAWGSFAARFGLEQVAIEEEGKEPSPSRLAALVREARRERVRALFVQRGFSTRSAQVLAAEVGAHLVELDPLARDWPSMMLETARALAER